jgi:hypothetical protein
MAGEKNMKKMASMVHEDFLIEIEAVACAPANAS